MNPTPADTLVLLKAIADPVRWQALQFLRDPAPSACSQEGRGVCACDFETVLGLSQPTVSHHMKQLVDAGLVRSEKRGRWVFYEIVPEAFAAIRGELAPFVADPQGGPVGASCGAPSTADATVASVAASVPPPEAR
jgi:ArsR family transcriptional regulator, arsenate/arsenite/antimonite-responsive transcriptional repressor